MERSVEKLVEIAATRSVESNMYHQGYLEILFMRHVQARLFREEPRLELKSKFCAMFLKLS